MIIQLIGNHRNIIITKGKIKIKYNLQYGCSLLNIILTLAVPIFMFSKNNFFFFWFSSKIDNPKIKKCLLFSRNCAIHIIMYISGTQNIEKKKYCFRYLILIYTFNRRYKIKDVGVIRIINKYMSESVFCLS